MNILKIIIVVLIVTLVLIVMCTTSCEKLLPLGAACKNSNLCSSLNCDNGICTVGDCVDDKDCKYGRCLPWDVGGVSKICCLDNFESGSGTFCKGLLPLGAACSDSNLCSSLNCVDGICVVNLVKTLKV